jgi:hypothetical protein
VKLVVVHLSHDLLWTHAVNHLISGVFNLEFKV